MQTTFEKLNLKSIMDIVVLNAPESFEAELASLKGVTVERELKRAGEVEFFLAFVTKQKEADLLSRAIAMKAAGDAVIWFAYPKGTSRRYKSEINRDSGWRVMGDAGFAPVRMVAIDDDWSAVRFRPVDKIKSMTRSRALSAQGKKRIAKK